jgi:hypothetical protein
MMSRRTAARLAWTLCALSLALTALRAHFKTHVRVSEADERGAALKETNVEHRPLHAHTTSVVPGFEMRSKSMS